tara:strand:- start:13082 stop:13477 length:396 start_codon:yes stop_codon:yes gene_type:complete
MSPLASVPERYQRVKFEESIWDMPPEVDQSSYVCYVGTEKEDPRPVLVVFDPADYVHAPCIRCFAEKCWQVEEAALIEYLAEYGYDGASYEHCCTCECHERVPLKQESNEEFIDDWGYHEDDDEGEGPALD